MVRLYMDEDFYDYLEEFIPPKKRLFIKYLIKKYDFLEFECEYIEAPKIMFHIPYISIRFTIIDKPTVYFDIHDINPNSPVGISIWSRFEEESE